jgi:hypothetical protein
MNDIYKKKAKKYKYKYLKLKQGYFAEGGWGKSFEGCTTNPPKKFSPESLEKLRIVQDTNFYIYIPNININSFAGNKDYIGRLLSYNDYNNELQIYKKNLQILNHSIKNFISLNMEKYIRKIVFACAIFKEERSPSVPGPIKAVLFPENHLKKTFPNCSTIGKEEFYGYIISDNSGKLLKDLSFSYQCIYNLLINLKDAIENFLKPLHESYYVLDDINWDKDINWDLNIHFKKDIYWDQNIYWDENKKNIYFNISKIKTNSNKDEHYKDFKGLLYYIFILCTFVPKLSYLIQIINKKLKDDDKITSDYLIRTLDVLIDYIKK